MNERGEILPRFFDLISSCVHVVQVMEGDAEGTGLEGDPGYQDICRSNADILIQGTGIRPAIRLSDWNMQRLPVVESRSVAFYVGNFDHLRRDTRNKEKKC